MIRILRSLFNKFREHIVEISTDRNLLESYLNCADEHQRGSLFTRTRVWTFQNVVNAILMCFKKSLTVEVMDYLLGRDMPLTSPEAYIKRRGLISDRLFRDLNEWLVRESSYTGMLKTWKCGRYLCGIDGTRLSMPYTPELYRLYRGRMDEGYNLARGAFVTDLVNRLIVSADIFPNKTEERKAAIGLLTSSDFPYPLQFTVFVMDRGYPSLYLMNWFHRNTGGFIIRARRDTNAAVAEFMDSDKTGTTVVLRLSSNRRNIDYEMPKPLEVRLIKRPQDDRMNASDKNADPVVYITDLDPSDFDDETIIQAYLMRWHSETEIGTAKNELQIEIFSGIRDICIRQDFYSAIILYNLGTLIRIPCNQRLSQHQGRHPLQVDMNCTWRLVITLISMLSGPPRQLSEQLTFTVKLFSRFCSVYRPGRSQPRHKRFIKTSGKYITFTNYKRGL